MSSPADYSFSDSPIHGLPLPEHEEAVGGFRRTSDGFIQWFGGVQSLEAAKVPRVEHYDQALHAAVDIAALHLVVRAQQEADGQNDFTNILSSQAELNDIAGNYTEIGGNFLFVRDEVTGEPIGMLGLMPDPDNEAAGFIKRFATRKDHRGKGIGSEMMTELIAWASKNGYQRLSLATGKGENAKGIYEKFGFKVVGFNEEHQDWLMEAELDDDA